MHGNLLEQIVVQLEIAEIDEFATVAPRDIPRVFQFIGNRCRFRHQFPAIPAAYQCCFLIRHAHSSSQPLINPGFKVSEFQGFNDIRIAL